MAAVKRPAAIPDAAAALLSACRDDDAGLRAAAVKALGAQIAHDRSSASVRELSVFFQDPDPIVREAAVDAIGHAGSLAAAGAVRRRRDAGHPMVGIMKASLLSASAKPSGQRWVTTLVLVQKRRPSIPYWPMSPKPERFHPPKV